MGGIAGLKVPPLSEPPWSLDDTQLGPEEKVEVRGAVDALRRGGWTNTPTASDSFRYEFVLTERTVVTLDESELTPALRSLLNHLAAAKR